MHNRVVLSKLAAINYYKHSKCNRTSTSTHLTTRTLLKLKLCVDFLVRVNPRAKCLLYPLQLCM